MANVVQLANNGRAIQVTLDGATDFNWGTDTFTTGRLKGMKVTDCFPQGLALTAINYYPPAVNAVLLVRDGSLTGSTIPPKFKAVTGDTMVKYFDGGVFYRPYIENDDQTTPTAAIIWFEYLNNPLQ